MNSYQSELALSLVRSAILVLLIQLDLSKLICISLFVKVAFIPYITAGDPDLSTTAEALKVLDACGSDIIELGVPYSDPLADGPVIQVKTNYQTAAFISYLCFHCIQFSVFVFCLIILLCYLFN